MTQSGELVVVIFPRVVSISRANMMLVWLISHMKQFAMYSPGMPLHVPPMAWLLMIGGATFRDAVSVEINLDSFRQWFVLEVPIQGQFCFIFFCML